MMATPQAVDQKQLINYRVDGGVAIIELDDAPANTYS
jgi:predicted type IV restriction endonuclease